MSQNVVDKVIDFYKQKCAKVAIPPIVLTTIDVMKIGGFITGLQLNLVESSNRSANWRKETMIRREEVYGLKVQIDKLQTLLRDSQLESISWKKEYNEQKSYKEKAIAQVIQLKRRGHVDV